MNNSEQPGYLLDAEDPIEMARLLLLGNTITDAIGSYFPLLQKDDLGTIRDVLDIGCGPGEWAIGVAQSYSHMTVTGIDISSKMMRFANLEAQSKGASACFQEVDATKPLPFPDASFDLAHARFIVGFMPKEQWAILLKECLRVLRPGGYLLLTEGDAYIMQSNALISIYLLMTKIMWKFRYSFVEEGGSFGLTPHLKPLFVEAGFRNVRRTTSLVDFSASEPAYENLFQNTLHFLEQFKQTVVEKAKALPEAEYEALRTQAIRDMQSPSFRGLWYLLNIVGQKPF